jgi:hypothetical protein
MFVLTNAGNIAFIKHNNMNYGLFNFVYAHITNLK